jgi:hypothetical protein
MNDQTLLTTLKNGIMIAGHEMGPVGDHWPAIHAISKGLDDDFFQIETDEAVLGELEFYLADTLNKMEDVAKNSSPSDRKIMMGYIKQKWEEYYAIFEPIDAKNQPDVDDMVIEGVNEFKNFRAALQVVKGLGGRV